MGIQCRSRETQFRLPEALTLDQYHRLFDVLQAKGGSSKEVGYKVDRYLGLAESAGRQERFNRSYLLLKFLTHPTQGKALWQALSETVPHVDRDRVLVNLWRRIEADFPEELVADHFSLSFHRSALFHWLLGRYDIRHAVGLLGGGWPITNLHRLLLVAMLSLFAGWRTGLIDAVPWVATLLITIYGLAALLLAATFRGALRHLTESFALAVQSLLPRLMGAAAVGVILLASSVELLGFVVFQVPWPWLLVLLGAGYLYLLLEMVRRIHPLPTASQLVARCSDLWAIALSHSLALTLIAEVGLSKILDPPLVGRFSWSQSAALVTFVFIIGLVVNLIWAEQPVTEPL